MKGHEVYTLILNGLGFKIKAYKNKANTAKCLLVNLQEGHKTVYYTSLNFSIDLNFFKMKNFGGV